MCNPMSRPTVTILSGGLGGARMARALVAEDIDDRSCFVTNVGDDLEVDGLLVCPDTDAVLYALADCFDEDRGWGVRDDVFPAGGVFPTESELPWFHVGERDRAHQGARAALLRRGFPLGDAVRTVAVGLGVRATLAPVTDAPVRTFVTTDRGTVAWQEWLVRDGARPEPRAVEYRGAASAAAGMVALEAIRDADVLLIAPSSPVASIAPILAIRGVVDAIASRNRPAIAISPHVARRPPISARDRDRARVRGALLEAQGFAHEPTSIARWYRGIAGVFVLDPVDVSDAPAVAAAGLEVLVAPAPLTTAEGLRQLVRALTSLGSDGPDGPARGP
jgi:LPPG:FO 2-phospho-L-lactate transferase